MLGDHPSYHQCISGEEAIRRLKASGYSRCYLTRYSEAHKSYILTIYQQQSPNDIEKHFKIVIEKNGRLKIYGETRMFKRIGKLLAYYETHRLDPSLCNIGRGYKEEEFNKKAVEQTDHEDGKNCIIS